MNKVPDALFRLYEDEPIRDIASVGVTETKDSWYCRLFKKIAANPADHPWWKIVGERLYHYRPDPTVQDLLKD